MVDAQSDEIMGQVSFEMVAPACTPGAEWWSAEISFQQDISPLLPYLNAELDQTEYYHQSRILIWDSGQRRYSFSSRKVAIAPVTDRAEAESLTDQLVAMLEGVWDRRDAITPDLSGKTPPPSPLQILKLLPRTNCRECGCPTCMAYAAALIQKTATLSQCTGLDSDSMSQLVVIFGQDRR